MTNKDNGGPASDRELLEMAAKAAGIVGVWTFGVDFSKDDPASTEAYWLSDENGFWLKEWNPLTDDGDALRLAVKLGMTVQVMDSCTLCESTEVRYETVVQHGEDAYEATRLAIVSAAAAIGEGMAPFPTADEIRENWT